MGVVHAIWFSIAHAFDIKRAVGFDLTRYVQIAYLRIKRQWTMDSLE